MICQRCLEEFHYRQPERMSKGRPPKLTPEQKALLVHKYMKGATKTSLAAEFGISSRIVSDYIRGTHKNPGLRA